MGNHEYCLVLDRGGDVKNNIVDYNVDLDFLADLLENDITDNLLIKIRKNGICQ